MPHCSNVHIELKGTQFQVTSSNVRSKLGSLWTEDLSGRHVTTSTKSKPYRGMENVFSIADDEEEDHLVRSFVYYYNFINQLYNLSIMLHKM